MKSIINVLVAICLFAISSANASPENCLERCEDYFGNENKSVCMRMCSQGKQGMAICQGLVPDKCDQSATEALLQCHEDLKNIYLKSGKSSEEDAAREAYEWCDDRRNKYNNIKLEGCDKTVGQVEDFCLEIL